MFKTAEGSIWKQIPASRLASIEIWKGNRILDENHVLRISQSLESITDLSANPYRIAVVEDEGETHRYIIDGQHRARLLKTYFKNPEALDFDVVIIEKNCTDEADVINYFKIINTTKSIQWREDPILVANMFIDLFVREFNKDPKKPVIRQGKVNKPFMSVDRLREVLISKHVVDWRSTPIEFVSRCRDINDQQLENLDLTINTNRRAKEMKFTLGVLDFNFI
jgi:hypothetical protein